MARGIRWFPPGVRFYEIVSKCTGDEMLMRPDPAAVILVAQALADACKAHPKVRLLGFCFVSNHYHLVVMVLDGGTVSRFMQKLNQQLAQTFNLLRERSGHFFAGRFKPTIILDEQHLLERLAYAHAQPVHHDLVARVEEWPGLSSFRAVCSGEDSVVVRVSSREIRVPLSRLPMWEGLSRRGQLGARQAHVDTIRNREREKALERAANDRRRVSDPERHTRTDPFSRPVGPRTRTPKPLAHGTREDVSAYRAAYSIVRASHRVASARFRASGTLCPFPEGTFPPWISATPADC